LKPRESGGDTAANIRPFGAQRKQDIRVLGFGKTEPDQIGSPGVASRLVAPGPTPDDLTSRIGFSDVRFMDLLLSQSGEAL
jgi:hypothetical protein